MDRKLRFQANCGHGWVSIAEFIRPCSALIRRTEISGRTICIWMQAQAERRASSVQRLNMKTSKWLVHECQYTAETRPKTKHRTRSHTMVGWIIRGAIREDDLKNRYYLDDGRPDIDPQGEFSRAAAIYVIHDPQRRLFGVRSGPAVDQLPGSKSEQLARRFPALVGRRSSPRSPSRGRGAITAFLVGAGRR